MKYVSHINPTAIIGNNIHLSQFTSIGANTPQAAHLGDNVYMGPGSIIVDYIEVGSGSCLGAGSVW